MFVLEELVHVVRVEKVHTTLTGCVRDTAFLNGYTMSVVRLDIYSYFQISPEFRPLHPSQFQVRQYRPQICYLPQHCLQRVIRLNVCSCRDCCQNKGALTQCLTWTSVQATCCLVGFTILSDIFCAGVNRHAIHQRLWVHVWI